MKIIISYPPLDTQKGCATLGQNRQFQYFKEPTFIYPVVPAQAATLLKNAGYEVIWNDCLALGWDCEQFIDFIRREKPDVIAFETKTPVVKQHWKIIDDIKGLSPQGTVPKVVLFGDHVTALPDESFQNSQVDFVLTGGDYDFLLLNLCTYLDRRPETADQRPFSLEPGIYFRENGQIKNTGKFQLNHDLNLLPFIDRELTQWRSYAYQNGNYKRTPGTYIMSGRDCWWGKCTFCLDPDSNILTNKGTIRIKDIVDSGNAAKEVLVLTHMGSFRRIVKTFKRFYKGALVSLEFFNLKEGLRLTPNHEILALRKHSIKRCSKKCNWSYLCIPDRVSKRMNCAICQRKYYNAYEPVFIEAGKLLRGDFVAVPIIKRVKDKRYLYIKDFLKENPGLVPTTKNKEDQLIYNIINRYNLGLSQREIAKVLNIDRQTVKRYIDLYSDDSLEFCVKSFVEDDGYIKYEYAKKWIPGKIHLSKDFFRLIGYYLAEGSVTKVANRPNSYCVVLTFSEKECDYINDVIEIANKIFGEIGVCKHSNKKNKTTQVTISSSILAILFKELFGSNSYDKKMPHEFLYFSLNKQKELLKGLFRGDGHLRIRYKGCGGTEYILSTVSKVMANQVVSILFRNKAIPRFRVVAPGKKGVAPQYSISLNQYDIEHLFPEIKLPQRKTKYRHGFILNDFVMIPISRINESNYNGLVYNLEIEKEHSYLANNIVVSNCSWPTLYPKFRSRSPENVLDEIEEIVGKYGVREIMDDSGCFPTGEWLKKFCEGRLTAV